jgi:hypothetical protein
MKNKIVVALSCLCIALAVGLGVVTHQLVEARATVDEAVEWCRKSKVKFGELTE